MTGHAEALLTLVHVGLFKIFHVSFCQHGGSLAMSCTSSSKVSTLWRATHGVFVSKLLHFRSRVDKELVQMASLVISPACESGGSRASDMASAGMLAEPMALQQSHD